MVDVLLTIMGDIDGSARSEDGENARIIEPGGACGTEFDLEWETGCIRTQAFRVTRRIICLGSVELKGREPAAWAMTKEFSGKELKTPRESLRSLRVSLPVLITVVVTCKLSNQSTTTVGINVLTAKLGAASTATAEATRTTRAAWREEDVIM